MPRPDEGGGPILYLKREDLLPYGGGHKMRRLLAWAEGVKFAGQSPETIAVPNAVSKLPCRAPTFASVVTHTSCHTFAGVIKNI